MKTEIPPQCEGWRMLEEGEPLQEGDGFWDSQYGRWIDYVCRPALFTGGGKEGSWYYCPKNETAHTYKWRRKTVTAL